LQATEFGVAETTTTTTDKKTETLMEAEMEVESLLMPAAIALDAEEDEYLAATVEQVAEKVVQEMLDEGCEVDQDTGALKDDLCVDEEKRTGFRATMKHYVGKTLRLVRSRTADGEDDVEEESKTEVPEGEILEKGCK
jgi:hypothetical protein